MKQRKYITNEFSSLFDSITYTQIANIMRGDFYLTRLKLKLKK
jgi:hypothetical protein